MAVREDWVRITQGFHNFLLAFRRHDGRTFGRNGRSKLNSPRVQHVSISVIRTIDPRLLAEIEHKRTRAYLSSLRNQIR